MLQETWSCSILKLPESYNSIIFFVFRLSSFEVFIIFIYTWICYCTTFYCKYFFLLHVRYINLIHTTVHHCFLLCAVFMTAISTAYLYYIKCYIIPAVYFCFDVHVGYKLKINFTDYLIFIIIYISNIFFLQFKIIIIKIEMCWVEYSLFKY